MVSIIDKLNTQERYFFLLANSRSGHNFIKGNIQSWTNDLEEKHRKYVNLENPLLEDVRYTLGDFSRYSGSIGVLNIRSLLNWYSSLFYFISRQPDKPLPLGERPIQDKIFVKESDLEKNPSLVSNPNVVVLSEGQTRENFLYSIRSGAFSFEKADKFLNHQLNIWLFMATEFIGNTNTFSSFIKTYYDEFFLSREYRKNICDKVGGTYNESKLNKVTRAGKYSTFDGEKFQGRAQQMNVLERYKEWKPEHDKYLHILREHSALDFYLNNFEITEGEKIWLENNTH